MLVECMAMVLIYGVDQARGKGKPFVNDTRQAHSRNNNRVLTATRLVSQSLSNLGSHNHHKPSSTRAP